MGILQWFGSFGSNGSNTSSEQGYGNSEYSNSPLLGVYRNLSYQECKEIYRFWPLGKRIASALPNFALSAPREIIFKNSPPEVVDEFLKLEKELNIDRIIRQCCIYSRIYGVSALFAVSRNVKPEEALTARLVWDNGVYFNVLDPLNIAGYYVNQDATSWSYQRVENIRIRGSAICARNRATLIFNDLPLYIQFTPSTFSFSGPSVYQNMTGLIKSWNRCVIALERLSTKAASIIVKSNSMSHASGINYAAIQRNLELIRNMENDGIAGLDDKGEIEFFQLSGVEEIDKITQQINTALMMALSDTPSAILLDKNLSNGLNDGTEDMKAIIMAVDNFRRLVLSPLYDFVDPYVMYSAFNPEFIEKMRKLYKSDYGKLGDLELLNLWRQDFQFEWGNLYPEPEEKVVQTQQAKIDLLLKVKELGANQKDIETELNAMDVFKSDMTLDNFDQNLTDMGDDSEDSFDQDTNDDRDTNDKEDKDE